jgi:hypothetical protein
VGECSDNTQIAAKGTWGVVVWSTVPQAREYFQMLDDGDKAKCLKLFQWMANDGKIINREKFRALGQEYGPIGRGLFEFKAFQIRFLGAFRPGGKFVIARGLTKKKDKHDRPDLEATQKVLAEYDALNPGKVRI